MFTMGGVASVPNNPYGFCGRKATLNERRGGDRAAIEVFNLRMVLINICQTSLLVLLHKPKAVCMQVALVGELGISCVTARSSGPGVNTFAIPESHHPRAQDLCESRGGRPGLPGPDDPSVRSLWT